MIAASIFSRRIFPILVAAFAPAFLSAQSTSETLVTKLTATWNTRFINARYLEKNPQAVTWPGYEGYPTLKCIYTVKDTSGAYAGVTKNAEVVLLNPPTATVARWAVNALLDVTGKATEADGNTIMQNILYASGGQFPVAGMVYEDMEGDGTYNHYSFRDGLTVAVTGISNGRTSPLSPAEIELTLTGPLTSANASYARIISTTRGMYTGNGGMADVTGLNYLPVIRQCFKAGFDTGRNELIAAWVRANFTPNQSPAAGAFPYADSFPAGGRQLTNWLDHYNYHLVKPLSPPSPGGDGYVMVVQDPGGGTDAASLGSQGATDYRVECDIYCDYRPALASDGFERVGIFARDTGGVFDTTVSGVAGNNYLMTWDTDDGRFRCGKTVNGTLTDLLPARIYLTSSGWRRMSIEVRGSQVTYRLDGAPQLSVTDSSHTAGKFGVGHREAYTTNSNARGTRADNFSAVAVTTSGLTDWALY